MVGDGMVSWCVYGTLTKNFLKLDIWWIMMLCLAQNSYSSRSSWPKKGHGDLNSSDTADLSADLAMRLKWSDCFCASSAWACEHEIFDGLLWTDVAVWSVNIICAHIMIQDNDNDNGNATITGVLSCNDQIYHNKITSSHMIMIFKIMWWLDGLFIPPC